MRNSLLATLIAFGTTVAMPANACCVQQKDAGKGVTTGIAGTTNAAPSETSNQYQKLMNAAKGAPMGSPAQTTKPAPSQTSDQHQKMNAGEGVTTGSAVSHDEMPQWYLRSEAPTLPPGTGPG